MQLGDEAGEGRPGRQPVERKAAGPRYRGERGGERGGLLAAQKFPDEDKVERLAGERGRAQAIEIEDAQAGLRSG